MSFMTVKFASQHGWKALRSVRRGMLRMSTTGEPCPPPPKPEPCPPPPPPPTGECPEPPPCPPPPKCPPTLCPPIQDPNNPCNYTPPPCIDPDYPDLTKLKKLQCKFQEDNGLPIYLKGGTFDVVLYHTTVIITLLSVCFTTYGLYRAASK